MPEFIIGDHNWQQHAGQNVVDGDHKAKGLVPRNFATCPHGSMLEAPGFDLTVIPQSEWAGRLADQLTQGRRNSDFRLRGNFGKPIPSRDQNGKGYCWAHSTVSALLVQRAIANLPYVSLSAYAVACVIKGYRDEGGWCGESLKYLTEKGVPSEEFWPQQSMNRANDNDAMRANAALHKVSEGFYDLGAPIWSQALTFEQLVTCLILNFPCAVDFNWWSHSVGGLDAVNGASQFGITRDEDSGKLLTMPLHDLVWGMNDPVTAGIGIRIWNSWGESYGDRGMAVLTGNQAKPDGAVAIRVSGGSVA